MPAQTITPPPSTRLQYSQLTSSVSTPGRASSADVDRLVQILQQQNNDDLTHKLENFSVKELSKALVSGPLDFLGWEGEPPSLAAAQEALEVMKNRVRSSSPSPNAECTEVDVSLPSETYMGEYPEWAGWNQNQNGSTSTITRPPDTSVQGTDWDGYYEDQYERYQVTGNPDDLYAGLGDQDGLPYQNQQFGYDNVPIKQEEEEDEADQDADAVADIDRETIYQDYKLVFESMSKEDLENGLGPGNESIFHQWTAGHPLMSRLDNDTKAQISMGAWLMAKRMSMEKDNTWWNESTFDVRS
ncbi:hypothetical protein TREMEDRAFT_66191 [Tremella mesenterica DSM 1558]|uniref:uncharacterized protein n=1 Tax=Tremella mesenterica (strain ATCC 24925 / CBS 8224 / DSM 1558 / NBRC 9311 / NRRL Y-6157 / RJB 2259-6 / UBC 559-6) TaxID=578456 RepID=UPI00032D1947|nr:uncharacterized protein TREMEDRAFT_66191 [Tremella mesenterica DSM 1558]EIW65822.1 hypothetical protein TREMEDRAFT_66191 [Tremella mesenterica DSM 1558]